MTGPPTSSREIGPVAIEVAARRRSSSRCPAIGQGQPRPGEQAERTGDTMVCEFTTVITPPLVPPQAVRTREWLHVVPPDRVNYRHLDDPVRGLKETIAVHPVGPSGARLEYHAVYPAAGAFGRLRYWLARPLIEHVMREHFRDLKDRAEERARRSRVFAPDFPVRPSL